MNTTFKSGEYLVKMTSTEGEITAMQAELGAICERVHKHILVVENVASHRIK